MAVPLVPLLFLRKREGGGGGRGAAELSKTWGTWGTKEANRMQGTEIIEEIEMERRGTPDERRGTDGGRGGTGRDTPLLRIRRISPHLPLPAYATAAASGLDLRAAADAAIAPGSVVRIPTGIALEIPEAYEGQVRPRSGMSLRGLPAILGTIDSDYRGEVGVLLHNLRPWPMHVSRGDRIAQLVIVPVARVRVVEVDELSETDRGDGGFGSTGVA